MAKIPDISLAAKNLEDFLIEHKDCSLTALKCYQIFYSSISKLDENLLPGEDFKRILNYVRNSLLFHFLTFIDCAVAKDDEEVKTVLRFIEELNEELKKGEA